MALAQTQTQRSMGQTRESRNNPSHTQSTIFYEGDQEHTKEKT